MKQYLVMAKDANSTTVVSEHATYEEAQDALDKCIEGDDKHDPCEYFIEEYLSLDIFNEKEMAVWTNSYLLTARNAIQNTFKGGSK